jgi:hypothetical protein
LFIPIGDKETIVWEYKIVSAFLHTDKAEILNCWGKKGWEAVCGIGKEGVLLKRQIQNVPDQ